MGSPYSEQLPFALSPEAFAFGAFAIRVIRDSRDSIRTSRIAVSQSGIRTSGGIREEAFARHSHSGVFRIRGNRPSRYSRISRQIATHCRAPPQRLPSLGQTAPGRRSNRDIVEAVWQSPFAPPAAVSIRSFAPRKGGLSHSRQSHSRRGSFAFAPFALRGIRIRSSLAKACPSDSLIRASTTLRDRATAAESDRGKWIAIPIRALGPCGKGDCCEVDCSVINLPSLCRGPFGQPSAHTAGCTRCRRRRNQ